MEIYFKNLFNHMEWYQAFFHLYVLLGELSKNVSLYYHIGNLFGYSGEELLIILLYSHFSYQISFYLIQLHQHMLTFWLDTYYFQVLTNLNLIQMFWPEHALHAARHLNVTSEISAAVNKNNNAKWTIL